MLNILILIIFGLMPDVYPEYFYIIDNYFWEGKFYSTEFQEFKIRKLIDDLKNMEFELALNEKMKIEKIKEKHLKKIKVFWIFDIPRYKNDKNFNYDAESSGGYLNNQFNLYKIENSDFDISVIEDGVKIKDEKTHRFCREYKGYENCFFYNYEYIFLKEKGKEIDLDSEAYKSITFQIIGLDAQKAAKIHKSIKLYGMIKAIKK